MQINTAIILAAGYGTRFLPYTKTIQKEMLPILNRPIIDYVVEDCIKAGITKIIFVINTHSGKQIQKYYSENKNLYEYLVRMKKPEKYDLVKDLHTKAEFIFVEQPESAEYGTAVPVKIAREYVQNEDAFVVLGGDDFIYNKNGESEIAKMIKLFKASNADGVITCIQVPANLINKYGIAEYAMQDGYRILTNLIEKPEVGTVESNLANISKYIFTPKLYNYLENQQVNKNSGELFITDTVLNMAKETKFAVNVPSGQYLDCGYIEGWLKTNLVIANRETKYAEIIKSINLDED